jgi:hypothetical protein
MGYISSGKNVNSKYLEMKGPGLCFDLGMMKQAGSLGNYITYLFN